MQRETRLSVENMESEKKSRKKLMTAVIMLLTTAVFFLLNSSAGKMRGSEQPFFPGKLVVNVDNTIHLVLFDHPGSRSQLMKELFNLGFYKEMQLWNDFFISRQPEKGAEK